MTLCCFGRKPGAEWNLPSRSRLGDWRTGAAKPGPEPSVSLPPSASLQLLLQLPAVRLQCSCSQSRWPRPEENETPRPRRTPFYSPVRKAKTYCADRHHLLWFAYCFHCDTLHPRTSRGPFARCFSPKVSWLHTPCACVQARSGGARRATSRRVRASAHSAGACPSAPYRTLLTSELRHNAACSASPSCAAC